MIRGAFLASLPTSLRSPNSAIRSACRACRDGSALPDGKHVNLRIFDWIWHIKGSMELGHELSDQEVFDRLAPLFREQGTSHELSQNTLTFTKKDQASQDKMAIFDSGVLQIEPGAGASVLRYHLTSRALLFCFLAPLFFLAMGQVAVLLAARDKAAAEVAEAAEMGVSGAIPKANKADVKERRLNPIDAALGAPPIVEPNKDFPPEKADEEDKADDGAEPPEKEASDEGPSPTPAYVFAGIFAALYVGGRLLESRLIARLFRKKLAGE